MISRAELDALFREDDKARAEHAHWMAQREPVASPLVQRNGGDHGLVFKTTNNARVDAPAVDGEAFCFTDEQFDALAYVVNELRAEWQRDIAKALSAAKNSDDDYVIDLPRGFIRRRHGSAA